VLVAASDDELRICRLFVRLSAAACVSLSIADDEDVSTPPPALRCCCTRRRAFRGAVTVATGFSPAAESLPMIDVAA